MRSRLLVAVVFVLAFGASAAYAGPLDLLPRGPGHGCGHGGCGTGSHGNGHGNGGCGHGHGHGNTCGEAGGGGNGGGNGGGGGNGTGTTPGGTTPGGTAPTGAVAGQGVLGATATDITAPAFVGRPQLHPTRFRAARRGASIAVRVGTTITYTLSEPARVTFTVQKFRPLSRVCRRRLSTSRHRTGTRCRRWISLKGRFAKASVAGANSARFRGRLKGRRLRPGAYRLVIRARDGSGNVSRPKRPTFRIVR